MPGVLSNLFTDVGRAVCVCSSVCLLLRVHLAGTEECSGEFGGLGPLGGCSGLRGKGGRQL